ncbi:MAG: OmpA family protein [Saprospiraceae bacterium]|nr:OmpA family protein [Saprospiraceae bacterium]MCB9343932.1 OmpA family protein [Lewinellaceae bacterium]
MKNFTLFLLFSLLLNLNSSFSQNQAFQNAIHAKLNAVDYGLLFNNELKVGQAFEFAYFRNVAPALNIGVPIKLGLAKIGGASENSVLTSFDLMFRLENIKSESKVIPFAFAGAGYILEEFKNGHVQFPFGAGLHYRLTNYAFISLQAEFRKALVDDRDNVQLGLGYVYLLHKSENKTMTPPEVPANDDDFDGIVNAEDKCPTEPGPAGTFGCPDRDNDGVADSDDLCPDEAGTFDTGGCPDHDGDGVADKDDECPTEAGPWNGCPDTDYDGVPDKDDKCPTEAGLAENQGCPMAKDSDGDGFDDDRDLCPSEPGTAGGCPDADKDGVADVNDKCPNVPGSLTNNGCPDVLDADGDGFADDVDQCPYTAGTINGCPDTDNDGVADKNDKCPEIAGSISNNGCPDIKDADGDGFPDDEDQCPYSAGTVKGCPDSDNDGVADINDKCPQEPGSVNNHGCPDIKDADGDGFADDVDQCPYSAGTVNGCPDADNDGIADIHDKCPQVAGVASNNGCPEVKDSDGDGFNDDVDECPQKAGTVNGCPDSDRDGIADKNDKCPQLPGPAKNNGCPEVKEDPDSDGDGVVDSIDKCPQTPGLASNNGCPEVKKEVQARLEYAARAVKFETAKSILKSESYAILDEIVNIMRQNPEYILAISGHTDDVGEDEENLELSQERARACYDYLLFRGIKAERLRHAGFGESRPIATNSTPEGRELNRRVEFEIIAN